MRALRAKNVLACQRAIRSYMLMCQRALRAYGFTCSPTCLACLCAHVPMCLARLHAHQHALHAFRVHVPTCLACLRAYVLTNVPCVLTCSPTCLACFSCSRANVPCVFCVPTCSRDINTNNKNKFSITSFPHIFVIVLCLFPVK